MPCLRLKAAPTRHLIATNQLQGRASCALRSVRSNRRATICFNQHWDAQFQRLFTSTSQRWQPRKPTTSPATADVNHPEPSSTDQSSNTPTTDGEETARFRKIKEKLALSGDSDLEDFLEEEDISYSEGNNAKAAYGAASSTSDGASQISPSNRQEESFVMSLSEAEEIIEPRKARTSKSGLLPQRSVEVGRRIKSRGSEREADEGHDSGVLNKSLLQGASKMRLRLPVVDLKVGNGRHRSISKDAETRMDGDIDSSEIDASPREEASTFDIDADEDFDSREDDSMTYREGSTMTELVSPAEEVRGKDIEDEDDNSMGQGYVNEGADQNNLAFDPVTYSDQRIFILGAGQSALFIAHTLTGISRPPFVTVISPIIQDALSWPEHGRKILVTRHNFTEERRGIHFRTVGKIVQERVRAGEDGQNPENRMIKHLIVTTKGAKTVRHLRRLAPYISPESTICFLQDGVGVIDEVNREIWPHGDWRPQYLQALSTHSLYTLGRWHLKYADIGTIAISQVPQPIQDSDTVDLDKFDPFTPSANYILWTLSRAHILAVYGLKPAAFLQLQLDRIAIRSCTEPLATMMDVQNGYLLSNDSITRLMRLLLVEACAVIQALPELKDRPNVRTRFQPGRIERRITTRLHMSAHVVCPMLKAIRYGRETGIQSLNGYIIRRGEEQQMNCVTHWTVMRMVLAMERLNEQKKDGEITDRPRDLS